MSFVMNVPATARPPDPEPPTAPVTDAATRVAMIVVPSVDDTEIRPGAETVASVMSALTVLPTSLVEYDTPALMTIAELLDPVNPIEAATPIAWMFAPDDAETVTPPTVVVTSTPSM